jgi:hypothetical protein
MTRDQLDVKTILNTEVYIERKLMKRYKALAAYRAMQADPQYRQQMSQAAQQFMSLQKSDPSKALPDTSKSRSRKRSKSTKECDVSGEGNENTTTKLQEILRLANDIQSRYKAHVLKSISTQSTPSTLESTQGAKGVADSSSAMDIQGSEVDASPVSNMSAGRRVRTGLPPAGSSSELGTKEETTRGGNVGRFTRSKKYPSQPISAQMLEINTLVDLKDSIVDYAGGWLRQKESDNNSEALAQDKPSSNGLLSMRGELDIVSLSSPATRSRLITALLQENISKNGFLNAYPIRSDTLAGSGISSPDGSDENVNATTAPFLFVTFFVATMVSNPYPQHK